MSRPYDCKAEVKSLRPIDEQKGEFWVSNPWAFMKSGENLSCYERDGVHLNTGGGKFVDMSYVSGADSDGDGRSVVAWDITGDGMPELILRQAGGGSLIVYRNRFPKASWLNVSLRGVKSNSFGIGSKLVCEAGGKRVCRELYPIVNFLSESPAAAHLGLGDAKKVDSLTIKWPSGEVQTLKDLEVNQYIQIREGDPAPRKVSAAQPK